MKKRASKRAAKKSVKRAAAGRAKRRASGDNKELVRQLTEQVWNQGNLASADKIISSDYIAHDPVIRHEPGLQGFKQHVTRIRNAFPDLYLTIEELVAEGDKVAERWTARATHKGEFLGVPPTGKEITVAGASLVRISGGKIVEHWATWDALGLMQQLGAVPALGRARAEAASA